MTLTTHQIGRPIGPFPIITDFLAYAIERQTMEDPMWVNLQTPEQVRAAGHQAECRDSDGHLTRTHVPFTTDEDVLWLVREAMECGETVTIWPMQAAGEVRHG